jgi:protein-export membrane protein SecD
VHLGLDLSGGSYLLMQIDMSSVVKERLQAISDEARGGLRKGGIAFSGLAIDGAANELHFHVRDDDQMDAARKVVNDMISGEATPEFAVASPGNNQISLTLSDAAMKARELAIIQQSQDIVRRRIDATGIVDPTITQQGDDRIVVQLPGVDDPNAIKDLLGRTAKMTFQMVDGDANVNIAATPDEQILPMADNPAEKLAVYRQISVDGGNLTDAQAAQDSQNGEWVVNLTFDSTGGREFADVSTANVGKRFAVVLDNQIIEAPVFREAITGGTGQISGGFTAASATNLALLLRAGALPAPLTVIEERTVGPELGADSIRAGALSLGVGFLLVIFFMAAFYGLFGWYANVALVANLVLMLAVLSLFQATLTLPGMAGILLTLGMAVDANILINERIREETHLGKKPIQAMQAGFERAYSTIIDSNITALLAHVMLFVFGTGPVRGFALTISIGIGTTLFTAILVSRLLMVRWYGKTRPAALPV